VNWDPSTWGRLLLLYQARGVFDPSKKQEGHCLWESGSCGKRQGMCVFLHKSCPVAWKILTQYLQADTKAVLNDATTLQLGSPKTVIFCSQFVCFFLGSRGSWPFKVRRSRRSHSQLGPGNPRVVLKMVTPTTLKKNAGDFWGEWGLCLGPGSLGGVVGIWGMDFLLLSLRKGTYAEFCVAKHLNSKLGNEIWTFMEKSHESTSQKLTGSLQNS